jgi:hypothetical protein
MGFNVKKWSLIGLRFIPYLGAIIGAVEEIKTAAKPQATGADKKKAALEAVQIGIVATEFALDKDILNEENVLGAMSGYIDAYVALQNAISKSKALKAAKAANAGEGE